MVRPAEEAVRLSFRLLHLRASRTGCRRSDGDQAPRLVGPFRWAGVLDGRALALWNAKLAIIEIRPNNMMKQGNFRPGSL